MDSVRAGGLTSGFILGSAGRQSKWKNACQRPGRRRPAAVKRVLLTGMSGPGSQVLSGNWPVWGTRRLTPTMDGVNRCLMGGSAGGRTRSRGFWTPRTPRCCSSPGCEENQVRFHLRFDLIILFSAPTWVILERLAARTTNRYGKTPGELRHVLDDVRVLEPRLRRVADHEVLTTMPPHDVVAAVLRLAGHATLPAL